MIHWDLELVSYAEGLRDAGHGHRKIAHAISARMGREVTPKAVERMFARRRCEDIPIHWDACCDETTEVEVPRPHVANDNQVERGLIIGDCHHPFVDKVAWNLMLDVARDLRPNRIIIMGDFLDMYQVSSHQKDSAKRVPIEHEIQSANHALDELDSLGAQHKDYLEGNHCFRLARHLYSKSPETASITRTIPELLRLNERGWSWTPYRDTLTVGKVHYTHDTGKAGATAFTKTQADYQSNSVIGHVHRLQVSYSGNILGERHVAVAAGWMGDASACEYMHKAVAMKEWQVGFCTSAMEQDGTTHIQAHPVVNGKVFVDGKLYTSSIAA